MKLLKKIFEKKSSINNIETKNIKFTEEDQIAYNNLNDFNMHINSGQDSFLSNSSDQTFANQCYIKNPVAFRAINIIAHAAAAINLYVMERNASKNSNHCLNTYSHEVSRLLDRPNPFTSKTDFLENIIYNMLIFGNVFILKIRFNNNVKELHILDNSSVEILTSRSFGMRKIGYRINNTDLNKRSEYMIDQINGDCDILHIKNYHPTDNIYGLSPLQAAIGHIQQHNNSVNWNNSLLRNGAKPSGIFSNGPAFSGNSGSSGGSGNASSILKNGQFTSIMSRGQINNVQDQIERVHIGPENAGRPMILNGNLTWHDLSSKQRDFDFLSSDQITTKHIANALGVPVQLLGDNSSSTYNNMLEAKKILYENTVLPLLNKIIVNLFNNWVCKDFDPSGGIFITIKEDEISALSYRLENTLDLLQKSDFMTINEKRAFMKLDPLVEK